MKRNMGRFRVVRAWIDDNLGAAIYRDVVPLEVRYAFDFDGWEVLALSDHFEPIEPGETAQHYEIEFQTEAWQSEDGTSGGEKVSGVRFVPYGR